MDRDAAVIALVDSNLHREHLLPSEKARAYKMKMDAMNHQGQRTDLTLSQLATKLDSAAEIGKAVGESRDKVFRYIRLTNLIPEILQMVDQGKIALTPAVELSYLKESEQKDLLETMESEDCTPSLSQSQQLKKLSQSGELDTDRIFELMRQPKANQEEKLRFDMKDIRRYFPKNYSTEKIQQTILRLLEKYERNWRRNRDER
jgi:ParB family chromosome partitioning protein